MSSDAASIGCPNCGWTFRVNAPEKRGKRVEGLLKSNDPPLESELGEIRAKTAAHTERLSTLDKRIAEMQSTLDRMQAERKWVDAELAELRQVSSPVRRLPGDVLSELFLACIDEEILHKKNIDDSLGIEEAPWVLSRICSRWRRVAKSYPQLWSTICLDLSTHGDENKTGTALRLGLQLQRTGSHSLNVWINSDSDSEIASDHYLLQVLLPSAYRWRQAVIVLPWESFTALEPIRGSLESLEALHVQANDEEPLGEIGQIDIFRYAPRLRYLCCQNIGLPVTSILTSTSQLTTYESCHDLAPKLPPRHIELLRNAPRLEQITLDCSLVEEDNSLPMTNPHLRRLEIIVSDWGIQRAYTDLLSCLTLPALEDISIDLQDHITFDIDCTILLLQRSQCSIVTLGLDAPLMTSGQLLELFHAIPSLERLTIGTYQCFSSDVLEELVWRPSAGSDADDSILPHLAEIVLVNFFWRAGVVCGCG